MESQDRQDRVEALQHLEDKLTNGKRGDIDTMCDYLVEQGRALKLMLRTDFVKATECVAKKTGKCMPETNKRAHPINWPTAAIIATILGIIWRILTSGGPAT